MLWSLVFYFFIVACTEKKKSGSVSIQWEGEKAVAIIVPKKFLVSVSNDSVNELLHISLAKSDLPVIGDYFIENDKVLFKPLIALTRGLKYKVYVRNELIDEVEVQAFNVTVPPEVIAVYPALDTLPENLLKFYISFSKPMQEGYALDHIHLIKGDRDTMSSVFLDLQQELWNKERTMLTLWLDPGRIKRGLQPNELLGPPLIKGSNYKLAIDEDWQDAEGVLLKENFIKIFFTGAHDSISPLVELWTVDVPKAGTKQHLTISFHESLDHLLAENALSVTDANGNELKGKLRVNDFGTIVYFLPAMEWKQGIYNLEIQSRLEDLAGNNLDRLFDRDLTEKQQPPKKIHKKQYEIR